MANKSSLLETGKHVTRRERLVARTAGDAFFFRAGVNASPNGEFVRVPPPTSLLFSSFLSRCDFRDVSTSGPLFARASIILGVG